MPSEINDKGEVTQRAINTTKTKSRNHALRYLGDVNRALRTLEILERAKETYEPIVQMHSSNCVISRLEYLDIGIAAIEVDYEGNIVQVQRIKKEDERTD